MAPTEVENSTTANAVSEAAPNRAVSRNWLPIVRRIYVAVASVLLTVVVGNYLASIAAQNVETKGEERSKRDSVAPVPGLSADDLAAAQAVLTPNEAPPARTQLLYLGDSQVFSRPDAPAGALNTPEWLQILLSRKDPQAVRVRIGASPGTDIPEMLLKVASASARQQRQDDILVIDLSIAEMRELGVRSDIQALLHTSSVNSDLKSLVAANSDLRDAGKMLDPVLNPQQAKQAEQAPEHFFADRLEDRLQNGAKGWSLFAQRENLIALGLLRYAQWEHRLLHITSDTRIPTPAAPYRTNLEVLELLMRYAQAQKIHIVIFFGPVRDLEPNPDAPADLARMHRDVTDLCQRYGVLCLDYSHAVPEALWADYARNQRGAFAMMAGQHDFYHFTEAAHQALAEKMFADAGTQLLGWSSPAGGAQ
jgi:hypothetical protein